MIELHIVKRTHEELVPLMREHYSAPKGFVGRNICYLVKSGGVVYGAVVGGSSTLHLPGRRDFFRWCALPPLEQIVNNIFFHVKPVNGLYPTRNFTTKVMRCFRERVAKDWQSKYGDEVVAFETLVELPRSGELYRRDGWREVGVTKGFTCKRVGGVGTDSWTGARQWDTQNLRPKRVFVRWRD